MKKIASIFISIIMVTSLYTSMQTNAAEIMSFSIIRYPTPPDAPSTYYYDIIEVLNNECDLVIANLSNCNLVVSSSALSDSPIVINSSGTYHLTFSSFLADNYVTLNLVPINSYMPSYCNGYISF